MSARLTPSASKPSSRAGALSTLRSQVGSLMIVGIEGKELSTIERAWLTLIRPSGVILFRRNIETPQQTYTLLAEINKTIGCDTFRCVDVEGGVVDRLRDAIAPMPSAAAVSATGKPALYRRHGVLIAREVCALGFNTTFAPVLDLALPASRNVLRTRTASSDPDQVIAYAGAFLEGLAAEGVLGCGKHFPGLGGGTLDSHQSTPRIDRTWDQLWQEDLLPYRALDGKLPMVMVSHAVYPSAIGNNAPASVSPDWIRNLLLRRLQYKGLVLSDDLEMGGILSHTTIEEAAVKAFLAGTHLIEVCKDPALIMRAFQAILSEAEQSPAFRRILQKTAKTITAAKKKSISAKPHINIPTAAYIARLRHSISAFAAKVPEPTKP